jgi:ABC-type transporter Mla subunit MlaD
MNMFEMFGNLEATGKQVADFIERTQALLARIEAAQTKIAERLESLEAGHGKLHDQNAEILGWLAEIDDDENDEIIESVENAANAVASAAEEVAEAAEAIAEESAEENSSELVMQENPSEDIAKAEETVKVEEPAKAEETVKVEETAPETRKEDEKLIETEVPPAPAKTGKRKRSFIRI